jgi:DNA-directed RNA polymerase specialized sigma24 family protein
MAGAERDRLADAIAELARPIAVRAARCRGLNDEDADDVAQHSCSRLLTFLQEGGRVNENPEALVWRIAERVTLDVHRRRQRADARDQRWLAETTVAHETVENPRMFWETAENQLQAKAQVREALEEAPENYRVAIQRVYFDGEQAEDIADEYYRAKVAAGEVDETSTATREHARKQARNKIDQQLKRGRDWLRKRLLGKLQDDEKEGN